MRNLSVYERTNLYKVSMHISYFIVFEATVFVIKSASINSMVVLQ